jgi:hypothetical protein
MRALWEARDIGENLGGALLPRGLPGRILRQIPGVGGPVTMLPSCRDEHGKILAEWSRG